MHPKALLTEHGVCPANPSKSYNQAAFARQRNAAIGHIKPRPTTTP